MHATVVGSVWAAVLVSLRMKDAGGDNDVPDAGGEDVE